MAPRRVVEVEVESPGSAIWWMVAGSAVGVAVGVLAAERLSGRPMRGRSLLRQLRRVARLAAGRWEPLLDVALDLREAWAERRAGRVRDEDLEPEDDDEALDEELDDDLDEDEDGAGAAAGGPDDHEDGEDGEDDENDENDEEGTTDHDGAAEETASPIGDRVLEAFVNDPVLAERAVEIDADGRGNVFLHGRVRTSREVAHAVTIAGGVPGVTSVRQRLRVRDRR